MLNKKQGGTSWGPSCPLDPCEQRELVPFFSRSSVRLRPLPDVTIRPMECGPCCLASEDQENATPFRIHLEMSLLDQTAKQGEQKKQSTCEDLGRGPAVAAKLTKKKRYLPNMPSRTRGPLMMKMFCQRFCFFVLGEAFITRGRHESAAPCCAVISLCERGSLGK